MGNSIETPIKLNNVNKTVSIHAFGCRSPNSKGIGLWDGAFVYGQNTLTHNVGGLFEDGIDFVSSSNDSFEKVYNDAVSIYSKKITGGWIPMTSEDMSKTAGIIIDETTNLIPPELQSDGVVFNFFREFLNTDFGKKMIDISIHNPEEMSKITHDIVTKTEMIDEVNSFFEKNKESLTSTPLAFMYESKDDPSKFITNFIGLTTNPVIVPEFNRAIKEALLDYKVKINEKIDSAIKQIDLSIKK